MNHKNIDTKHSINETFQQLNPKIKSVITLEPGEYKEDLIIPPNVCLMGTGVADLGFTTIIGKHIFPNSGSIGFRDIKFINDKNIFENHELADLDFLFHGCNLDCNSGYPLYLPKTSGNGIFFDCWIHGESHGFILNEKSLNLKIFNATIETKNLYYPIILNDDTLFFNVHLNQLMTHINQDKTKFKGGCWIE